MRASVWTDRAAAGAVGGTDGWAGGGDGKGATSDGEGVGGGTGGWPGGGDGKRAMISGKEQEEAWAGVTPQPKGLIELIEYSCQQVATSFPEPDLERTPKLSVLGLEQFRDG